MDKLKGKKIVYLYHDSAYGKEPIPVLDAQAPKYGFESLKHPGAAPGQRAGIAVAADPPGQARLGDPVGLGRDESDRAQGGGEDRLSARQDRRRLVVGLGRGRDSRGRRGQGLRRAAFSASGHQLPGDAGHQEEGLRRRQGRPRGQDAHRHDLPHPRRRLRHHHRRGDPQGAGEVRQGQGDDARAGALGHREPQHHRRAASRSWARPASSRRSR